MPRSTASKHVAKSKKAPKGQDGAPFARDGVKFQIAPPRLFTAQHRDFASGMHSADTSTESTYDLDSVDGETCALRADLTMLKEEKKKMDELMCLQLEDIRSLAEQNEQLQERILNA